MILAEMNNPNIVDRLGKAEDFIFRCTNCKTKIEPKRERFNHLNRVVCPHCLNAQAANYCEYSASYSYSYPHEI